MVKVFIYGLLVSYCCATWGQDLSTKKPKKSRKADIVLDENNNTVEKTIESIYFNLGAHTEFYSSVQVDANGGVRKIDYKPTIGAGLQMPFYAGKFLPEFNWVLPQKAGSSKIIKNLFMIRGDFAYDPLEWLRLRLGTSLMWANQHGQGGSANIRNGNDTSTFYYPDENRSSINNTFDVGIEGKWDDWALRLQTYTYAIFRNDRRQISYTIFLTHYWDQ